MSATEIRALARSLLELCKSRKLTVATAESCTGGLVAGALTEIAGSSAVVMVGFVTYSNEAKIDMLGVSRATLEKHGAVSAETAHEMAAGALKNSRAGIALSVTGIAGPDGGSAEKPVGLVWFGMALSGKPVVTEKRVFENFGRDFIRRETVRHVLKMGLRALA